MRQKVGIAGEYLTGAEMAAAFGKVLGSEWYTTRCRPKCIAGSGFREQRTWETCFSSSATSTRHFARRGVWNIASFESAVADVRAMAACQCGAYSDRLGRDSLSVLRKRWYAEDALRPHSCGYLPGVSGRRLIQFKTLQDVGAVLIALMKFEGGRLHRSSRNLPNNCKRSRSGIPISP